MPVPETITKLIEGSGNNFHAKVARWFTEHGWAVAVSPYYMDQTLSKARELDLIVEKVWPINDRYGRATADVVVIRLFVECKYVAAEAVLWFAPKNDSAATQLVHGFGFRRDNIYSKEHHYLAKCPRVAKLFASGNKPSPDNDPIYKALNQALNGMVAMRSNTPGLLTYYGDRRVELNYPVVVCSSFSQLYAADFLADAEPTPITENFQMEVQYAYLRNAREYNEYFLLDFVEFAQLETYQQDLDVDAAKAAFFASSS